MSLRCNVFSGGKDMPFFGAFKSSLALLQIPENIIPSSLRGSVAADPSTIYPSDADLINRAALRTLRVLQRPKTEEEITAFLTLQENSLTAAVYTIYEGDSDFHKEQLRTISALVRQGQDPEDCFAEEAKRHLDLAYRRREQDPAFDVLPLLKSCHYPKL